MVSPSPCVSNYILVSVTPESVTLVTLKFYLYFKQGGLSK